MLESEYLNFKAGTQCRDFIYIDDIISTILWFYKNSNISGIFNLGTGKASSFNNVAYEIIKNYAESNKNSFQETIRYIDFPDHLKGRYQSYTLANMNLIKKTGFVHNFMDIEEGVAKYIQKLKANEE